MSFRGSAPAPFRAVRIAVRAASRATVAALAVSALMAIPPAALSGQSTVNVAGWPGAGVSIGFASSVAVDGESILVGAPGEVALFPIPANRPGAVLRFSPDGDGWAADGDVASEAAGIGDRFGFALAVDRDRMVVGSPSMADGRGAAVVFERDGAMGPWRETAVLVPLAAAAGDSVGVSVAVHGGRVLVGAPGVEGGHGAAWAFSVDAAGQWSETADLRPVAVATEGRFGASVALDGGVAAVGAPGAFPGLLPGPPPQMRPGGVYLYDADWELATRFTAAGPGPEGFGWAMAFRAGELLVTAPIANRGAGALHRFGLDQAGVWGPVGTVAMATPVVQSALGYTLALAGEDVLLGGPLAFGAAGMVVVFREGPDGVWGEAQQIAHATPQAFFGSALGGADDLMVVGAPAAHFFTGLGAVYRRDEAGQWASAGTVVDDAGGLTALVGSPSECEDGSATGFDCADVDLVSFLPVEDLGGGRGIMVNDVWGWTDPESGREYAIVGRFDATVFLDVTDPANPKVLGELPLHEGASPNLWRDIKVYANHAFIVADGAGAHGVQVFDLRQLREPATEPRLFDETAHYDGIASAHNIVVNESSGFAYVVGASGGGETCGGGLHMIDIRDPSAPTFAGCFADASTGIASTGYSHDAQCVAYAGPDPEHQGKEVCFGANETALSISDVSDKENPLPLATASYPNVAYLHQGWLSEDHRWFYMNDELDELSGGVSGTRTLVWDVEDLDDPVLATEHISENRASDHNLYVRGQFMYQSNYVSGLRILDVSDPANPVEVAYFDTVPFGDDVPGFAGSFSNYPFFESGNILVTSMQEGLFILRKRDRPVF